MKSWYWILLTLGAALLPLGLNWVIQQPQQFAIVGDETHWLSFWVTYISAIASFAMVLITWQTLRQNQRVIDQNDTTLNQNQEQLVELKRQWEEQNRPRLCFSVVRKENLYYIRVSNTGSIAALGVEINFDETYFNDIGSDFCKYYPKSKFVLEANKSQYLPICYNTLQEVDSFLKKRDTITINGCYNNSYKIDENLLLSEYMQFEIDFNFDAELVEIKGFDKVKEGMTKNNRSELFSIQKSLDIIANKISEIKIETDNDTK